MIPILAIGRFIAALPADRLSDHVVLALLQTCSTIRGESNVTRFPTISILEIFSLLIC